MSRLYRTISSRKLIEMAEENPDSIPLLEEIIQELAQRHSENQPSLEAEMRVGLILNAAEERAKNTQAVSGKTKDGFFRWPSTKAPISAYGYEGDFYFYKEGVLHFVGYIVGKEGENMPRRQAILNCVFHNRLPNVDSPEYMKEWGEPKTPHRLKKLADCIAAFTRNAKRNSGGDYSQAIREWETDLQYLYDKYYVGEFDFAWPETSGQPSGRSPAL